MPDRFFGLLPSRVAGCNYALSSPRILLGTAEQKPTELWYRSGRHGIVFTGRNWGDMGSYMVFKPLNREMSYHEIFLGMTSFKGIAWRSRGNEAVSFG